MDVYRLLARALADPGPESLAELDAELAWIARARARVGDLPGKAPTPGEPGDAVAAAAGNPTQELIARELAGAGPLRAVEISTRLRLSQPVVS